MTYRLTVKEVAEEVVIYATFMPKPVGGVNGSGMHTHQSLFEGDRNAFFDGTDEYHLSKTARRYIAGLLAYAPEITLVTNQWVNSYKRLVPGFEAPLRFGRPAPQRLDPRAPVQPGKRRRRDRVPRPTPPATPTSRCREQPGLAGMSAREGASDNI
jgi:glutamine synthetase